MGSVNDKNNQVVQCLGEERMENIEMRHLAGPCNGGHMHSSSLLGPVMLGLQIQCRKGDGVQGNDSLTHWSKLRAMMITLALFVHDL